MLPQCIISDDSEGEMDGRGDSSYYSIKLINPDRKSKYSIEKWCTRRVFKTVSHLTTKLKEKYAELEPCRELRVGYMDPGHGWKGKQHWITCDEDLKDMYKVYNSKAEILIWCFLPGKPENSTKNRKNPSANNDPAEKHTKCAAGICKMYWYSQMIMST